MDVSLLFMYDYEFIKKNVIAVVFIISFHKFVNEVADTIAMR